MRKNENKLMRRRLVNAYLSSVVSISLVLLLVGVAAMLLVNTRSVSEFFKENLQVSVMMKQEVSDEEAAVFKNEIDSMRFVRNAELITKARGEKEMAEMLGTDFLSVFETSPIPVSIVVTLDADYVSRDSLKIVEKAMMKSPMVDEVVYQKSLVDALNSNLNRISMVLGVFIALMLFISFVLINNTMRLNVFARRFTVHTMKLVGATRAFIRGPFLLRAAFLGLFASVIALVMLTGLLFVIRAEFAQLFEIFTLPRLLIVMGVVVASGLIICVISTWFVVNKLVSLDKDELYY
ncbi:MAG: permease-like cell division protein FtsX [Candidatus Cryptobacteroides sp.]|nr:permease-like cell division protein FtsX [Bacteroidales bacterium]MDD7083729.1 permease-like cell division protein FtsX [Bacteroidales bacterium]MDY3226988.1 permease-like cell division protein FtsX [Candidatus Cryptobacteroides sp.]MDY5262417.1 permease-like cell division protein FtsX [Candidatus Cryptobacteroides sp.]MDY5570409.1 permease-like cell division protein FtsX [Candidatus Cryptobacteroides sp.]